MWLTAVWYSYTRLFKKNGSGRNKKFCCIESGVLVIKTDRKCMGQLTYSFSLLLAEYSRHTRMSTHTQPTQVHSSNPSPSVASSVEVVCFPFLHTKYVSIQVHEIFFLQSTKFPTFSQWLLLLCIRMLVSISLQKQAPLFVRVSGLFMCLHCMNYVFLFTVARPYCCSRDASRMNTQQIGACPPLD